MHLRCRVKKSTWTLWSFHGRLKTLCDRQFVGVNDSVMRLSEFFSINKGSVYPDTTAFHVKDNGKKFSIYKMQKLPQSLLAGSSCPAILGPD